MTVRVVELTQDLVDEAARLHTRIWQVAYRGMVPDEALDALDWRTRRDEFATLLAHPLRVGWMAAVDQENRMRGHVRAGRAPAGHEPGVGELYLLYVDPDHWGTGLAQRLLGVGEGLMTEAGCDRGQLWTFEANRRSQAFYRANGWALDGRSMQDTSILPGHAITEVALTRTLS